MDKAIERVLISKEEIKKRVVELGKEITKDYKGKDLILVGVLKGGFVFLADLMREIKMDLSVDLIAVSSYGASTKSSGVVMLIKDLDLDITNKDVLIVEDIVDSGLTLSYLKENFLTRHPASVKICTFLNKPERRKVEIDIDYTGFVIPDEFVIGYGLDYAEKYRDLADVCILNPNEYE